MIFALDLLIYLEEIGSIHFRDNLHGCASLSRRHFFGNETLKTLLLNNFVINYAEVTKFGKI